MKKTFSVIVCIILLGMMLSFSVSAINTNDEICSVIEQYYDISYDAWCDLTPADFTNILDPESIQCRNKVTVLNQIIDQTKYMYAKGYYSGTQERFDYNIDFKNIVIDGDEATVCAELSQAVDGLATYPIFICLEDNVFHLTKKDGKWLIKTHDYSGIDQFEHSVNELYYYNLTEVYATIDSLYNENFYRFEESIVEGVNPNATPYQDIAYSAERAVTYASNYGGPANNKTLFGDELSSNCTNFISQCISYGFGPSDKTGMESISSFRMVNNGNPITGWYGTQYGYSQPWSNVIDHWNYIFSNKTNLEGPRGIRTNASNLQKGDIMQMETEDSGTYSHSLICIDATNQIFAQDSSSSGTRKLSDVTTSIIRFYRPTYFRVY